MLEKLFKLGIGEFTQSTLGVIIIGSVVSIFTFFGFITSYLVFKYPEFSKQLDRKAFESEIFQAIFIFLGTLAVLSLVILWAIRRFSKQARSAAETELENAGLISDTQRTFDNSLKRELQRAVKKLESNADRLVEDNLTKLVEERFSDGLVKSLGVRVRNSAKNFAAETALDEYLKGIKSDVNIRLLDYANKANSQAGRFRLLALVFAVIGVVAAILAYYFSPSFQAVVAGSSIVDGSKPSSSGKSFFDSLYRYAPVYLIVILSEFLALILFRVSAKLSEQMRYFSNEATNNDLKFAAIKLGIHYGKPVDMVAMANLLQRTERNFLLEKGQTTVELVANQQEMTSVENIFAKFGMKPTPTGSAKTSKPK